jgi:hypothetical protein
MKESEKKKEIFVLTLPEKTQLANVDYSLVVFVTSKKISN